ncbi:paired amphipathic helix protein Sin3b-like [Hordeum vulgare subsp. vulgare]|uniref:paired amphipathic helix protein Sin3b-like n=1 Tax=Hordeum vulgare subsp. vulgare TaxID=112509 RepID=UPI001D1A471D|nr:paired amphipathic helix protein Sin3b-like [Hordeum vulgare subsp. vulgare]
MAQQLPDRISGSDAHAGLSLLQDVKARFASDPAVHQEFFGLLVTFRKGEGEVADVRAVVDRAYALLQGHPDLAQRFDAFNPFLCRPGQHEAEPAREVPPTRPRRERRRPVVVDADFVDDACAGPLQFLERVKLAGAGLYDRVLAMLMHVHAEESINANEIYKQAREVFGPADGDLLRGFAEYLPTGRDFLGRRAMKEPLEEHRAPAAKRKAPAAANPGGGKKKKHVDTSKRDEFAEFRKAWEFETAYSKLVVTMRRTKKALEEEPHGRPRKFEELYPGRECRGVLEEMYGDMFGAMREALEDDARTELALKTILRRLRKLEQVAVKVAMERRDPARVKDQLYKRVMDLKKEEEIGARDCGGA